MKKKTSSQGSLANVLKPLNTLFAALLIMLAAGLANKTFAQCTLPVVDGEVNVCLNSTYIYRVTNVPLPLSPGSNYTWTISGGHTPVPGIPSPIGEIKYIQWTQPGSWTVSVYLNTCGTSYTKTLTVNVSNQPAPAAPGPITGITTACLNEASTYTVDQQPGITYNWKVMRSVFPFELMPMPITVSGNQASVTWNAAGSYNIFAYASNGTCVSPTGSSLGVGIDVPSQPHVYYNTTVCANSSHQYSISNAFHGATYTWTPTGNLSISSSGSTATLNFGAPGTSTISVTASNSCGTSAPFTFTMTSVAPPAKPTINGPATTCINTPAFFTISPAYSSNWEVTPNANYTVSGTTLTFTQPGTYQVRGRVWSSPCYSEFSDPRTIVVNAPVPAPLISGNTTLCENTTGTITIANPVPDVTYTWMANGPISVNGNNSPAPVTSNSVTVSASIPGTFSLSVWPSQPAGCTGGAVPPVSYPLTFHTPLTTSNVSEILGSTAVCSDIYPYKINQQPSPAMTVTWTLSGGGSLINTANRLTDVNWFTAGNHTLTATTSNACGAGPTRQLPVTVNAGAAPPLYPIIGTSSACLNNTDVYSTTHNATLSYIWTATGQVIASSGNTASIKWTTPSSTGWPQSVSVQTNNGVCDSRPTVLAVSVNYPVAQSHFFPPLASVKYGNPPFTVSASSSSGIPFAYSSSNTAVATISGNTVTIVGAGTTTITASNPGNNCYQPISLTQNLMVTPAQQTISFASLPSKNFGDLPFTLSATASSGLPLTFSSSNTGVATINGNLVTITGPGTTTITASQAGNSNYNPVSTQQALFVALPGPAVPASFIEFSNVTATGMNIGFIPGNGNKRLVVIKPESPDNFFTPVNNTFYNEGYTSSGSVVVMSGAGTLAAVGDLLPGVKYFVKVFEFREVGSFTTYLTSYVLTGAQLTPGENAGARMSAPAATQATEETDPDAASFDVEVFGNPFQKRLTFRVTSSRHPGASVSLTDISGKVIQKLYVSTNTTTEIEKPMAQGVYLLKVSTALEHKVVRVAKID